MLLLTSSRSVAQAAAGWTSRCVDRDVDATLSPKSSNETSVRTTAFASVTLRNNREVVLAAAVENGMALEFAGLGLKDDLIVVLAAVDAI